MAALYPEGYLFWAGDPEPFPGPVNGLPSNIIEMNVDSVRTLGTEDVLKQYDPVSDALQITYSSNCIYMVSFKLTSYSYDFPAYDQLRKLCLRLRRQENLDALNAINMGYCQHFDIIDLEVIADQRELYCATVDVEFSGITSETDVTASGGVIATIGGWSGPVGATNGIKGTYTLPGVS
jgi:hypothetical protein